jgi:hypothetical protein
LVTAELDSFAQVALRASSQVARAEPVSPRVSQALREQSPDAPERVASPSAQELPDVPERVELASMQADLGEASELLDAPDPLSPELACQPERREVKARAS